MRREYLAFGAVSKVIATLDSDLVVQREVGPATGPAACALLQPEKLLDLLGRDSTPRKSRGHGSGKPPSPPRIYAQALGKWQEGNPAVGSGRRVKAVAAYATECQGGPPVSYAATSPVSLAFLGKDMRETESSQPQTPRNRQQLRVCSAAPGMGLPQTASFRGIPDPVLALGGSAAARKSPGGAGGIVRPLETLWRNILVFNSTVAVSSTKARAPRFLGRSPATTWRAEVRVAAYSHCFDQRAPGHHARHSNLSVSHRKAHMETTSFSRRTLRGRGWGWAT